MAKTKQGKKIVPVKSHSRKLPNKRSSVHVKRHRRSTPN